MDKSEQQFPPINGRHELTLLSRSYCHLCADMEALLRTLLAQPLAESRVLLTVCDVDADPALVAKYDELVPVLLCDGEELCHYHLDEARLWATLGLGLR